MLKYQFEYLWARLGEKGQGIVEYALILAFVVAIAVIALKSDSGIGQAIQDIFGDTGNNIKSANVGGTGGE